MVMTGGWFSIVLTRLGGRWGFPENGDEQWWIMVNTGEQWLIVIYWIWGFPENGGSKNGWLISGKILSRNGWELGVSPWLWKPPDGGIRYLFWGFKQKRYGDVVGYSWQPQVKPGHWTCPEMEDKKKGPRASTMDLPVSHVWFTLEAWFTWFISFSPALTIAKMIEPLPIDRFYSCLSLLQKTWWHCPSWCQRLPEAIFLGSSHMGMDPKPPNIPHRNHVFFYRGVTHVQGCLIYNFLADYSHPEILAFWGTRDRIPPLRNR